MRHVRFLIEEIALELAGERLDDVYAGYIYDESIHACTYSGSTYILW